MPRPRRFIALAVALIAVLVSACSGQPSSAPAAPSTPAQAPAAATPAQPKPGGQLTLGIRQEPSSLDPQGSANTSSQRALAHLYDSLIFMTNDGQFKPWLATKWEISPDGKVYTFTLREGVKFHDGTPFTAEAVKVTMDRIFDPETGSTSAKSAIGPYDKTEVVDPKTVKIHLKTPYSPLLNSLSQSFFGIVSPEAVKKSGNKNFGKAPVGTGPFKFEKMVPQDHIALVKNPDYNWPPEGVFKHTGPAYLDRIIIKTIPENQTRLTTLQNGEANVIEPVPEQDVESLAKDKNLYVMSKVYPGAGRIMFLNTQKFPTDDVAVRRAILQAVDTSALVKTLFSGQHEVGRGPLTPSTMGYNKKFETTYTFDVEKSKQTLEAAGWRAGADGIRAKDGKKLELVFYNIANAGQDGPAEFVQAQLRQVGIQVTIKSLARAAWYEGINKGEHNLVALIFFYNEPDVLRLIYHSKNIPFNWSHLKDTEMDKQLEAAYQENDQAKRVAMYEQIQQKIMDHANVLPLFYEKNILGVSKKLQGIVFDPTAYPLFYDAYLTDAK